MLKYKKFFGIFTLGVLCSPLLNASTINVPIPTFPPKAPSLESQTNGIYFVNENSLTTENKASPQSIFQPLNLNGQKKAESNLSANTNAGPIVQPLTVPTQYTFANCTAFTLGTGLYTSLTAPGQVKCFNTYSASDIKIVAQATSQPAGVDYDLLVYYYNPTTSALELKSTGQLSGNVDEFAAAKMPAGNYLIYVSATTGSSATQFIVGALGYSAYDQYEANDTPSYATPLSGNQAVTGNSDYAGDLDYFAYTTETGQTQFQVKLISSPNHNVQIFNGSTWVSASGALISSSQNTTYYLRVYNVASPNNTAVNYTLAVTYPVTSLGNAQVTNNEGLPDLGLGLEVKSRIIFTGSAYDSKQRVVPYGVVTLTYLGVLGTVTNLYQTGANGLVNYTLNFTACTGGGYYGLGVNGHSAPAFIYSGMATPLGVFQICSP